jgi:sugar/nucleoside kinase (ribokinase family)
VENTESAMLGWAKRMRDRYGATVIVTRGAEGCVAADRDGTELAVPAFPVETVVDSTGSGDVFRAGYLFGRLQGWDLLKTLRFGSAAAAMNCGAMGAWTGVKDLESTLAFLSERTANASNRERV